MYLEHFTAVQGFGGLPSDPDSRGLALATLARIAATPSQAFQRDAMGQALARQLSSWFQKIRGLNTAAKAYRAGGLNFESTPQYAAMKTNLEGEAGVIMDQLESWMRAWGLKATQLYTSMPFGELRSRFF